MARAPEPRIPESLVGKPLPGLEDLGVTIECEGKRVLVCFWSAEERPSRRCLRLLAEKAAELQGKGVAALAVHAAPIDEQALSEIKSRYQITFPVAVLGEDAQETRFKWGVESLPWLILANKDHVVQAEGFGIEEVDEKLGGLTGR